MIHEKINCTQNAVFCAGVISIDAADSPDTTPTVNNEKLKGYHQQHMQMPIRKTKIIAIRARITKCCFCIFTSERNSNTKCDICIRSHYIIRFRFVNVKRKNFYVLHKISKQPRGLSPGRSPGLLYSILCIVTVVCYL